MSDSDSDTRSMDAVTTRAPTSEDRSTNYLRLGPLRPDPDHIIKDTAIRAVAYQYG